MSDEITKNKNGTMSYGPGSYVKYAEFNKKAQKEAIIETIEQTRQNLQQVAFTDYTKPDFRPIRPDELFATSKENLQVGTKLDNGKADLSLLPKELLEEIAKAFMVGEKKYGRFQYLNGFKTSRLIAAALRHLVKYSNGEDYDQDDGQHHLGAAGACFGMLLKLQAIGKLEDDRFPTNK